MQKHLTRPFLSDKFVHVCGHLRKTVAQGKPSKLFGDTRIAIPESNHTVSNDLDNTNRTVGRIQG